VALPANSREIPPGEAVSREQLLDAVWGYDAMMYTRTVDNNFAKLRQKIEGDPENSA
jgi:two-component system alkaline phosphatase synthesis response regulator PhoP